MKDHLYKEIVSERKRCHLCDGMANPADVNNGIYDCDEIGAWTYWQGNLYADIILVGQDWGDVENYIKYKGIDPMNGQTNKRLIRLFKTIGYNIDTINLITKHKEIVYFTNAVLCLKNGGMQAKVDDKFFLTCGARYLKKQIEIVSPKVVIALGEKAFIAIKKAFNLPNYVFRYSVRNNDGILLPNKSMLFPVYHCSPGGRRNRTDEEQLLDWKRIGVFLNSIDV